VKVVYTEEALQNLDEVLRYVSTHYPAVSAAFEERVRNVVARIAAWPESAQEVRERPGVRMALLIRYPYKIFYRIADETVEILHIHHTARRSPWEGD
jgi:plasmid stabilization system protein ParE